jgi:outer membrane protein assembly factor BamA
MMRQGLRHFLCATALSLALTSPAWAESMIRDIRVEGSERVEAATVLTYLSLHKGDVLNQDALDASLKSLFATGLFADVQLSENNGVASSGGDISISAGNDLDLTKYRPAFQQW